MFDCGFAISMNLNGRHCRFGSKTKVVKYESDPQEDTETKYKVNIKDEYHRMALFLFKTLSVNRICYQLGVGGCLSIKRNIDKVGRRFLDANERGYIFFSQIHIV